MSEEKTGTQSPPGHRVIIMHGFSFEEINRVMKVVKEQFDAPRDLVFAKTTETSLTMVLKELIEDMCEDHDYLKRNPPNLANGRRRAQPEPPGESN